MKKSSYLANLLHSCIMAIITWVFTGSFLILSMSEKPPITPTVTRITIGGTVLGQNWNQYETKENNFYYYVESPNSTGKNVTCIEYCAKNNMPNLHYKGYFNKSDNAQNNGFKCFLNLFYTNHFETFLANQKLSDRYSQNYIPVNPEEALFKIPRTEIHWKNIGIATTVLAAGGISAYLLKDRIGQYAPNALRSTTSWLLAKLRR